MVVAMSGLKARLILALALLALEARAQISIISPRSLKDQFGATNGKIEGSTATFGAPFYGDTVLGRLVWGESLTGKHHCTEDDYRFQAPDDGTAEGSARASPRLINIALVRRGGCTFTRKVRVAMAKGAHAVVIVDSPESKITSSKIAHDTVVADDGDGFLVHIPSIFISNMDGAPLIAAAKARDTPVVIELAWTLPMGHIVKLDLWMSSASMESFRFLQEFAPKRRVLNQLISFRPQYAVFKMPRTDPANLRDVCSDDTGRFCTEDPDGPGHVSGKDVLDEDVRQLCIHDHTKTETDTMKSPGHVQINYADKYWRYVEQFLDRCPLDGTEPGRSFGVVCSEQLMHHVGLDVQIIRDCVHKTRDAKLQYAVNHSAWSPSAVRINGWRYKGMLTADLVTRAICAAFMVQPPECKELLVQRDPFEVYTGNSVVVVQGVSLAKIMAVNIFAFFVLFAAGVFYLRSMKLSVRKAVRDEVMLEVEARMGEYRQFCD